MRLLGKFRNGPDLYRFLSLVIAVDLLGGLLLVHPCVWAAPIPMTSSSKILNQDPGFFVSPLGFTLSAAGTNWKFRADLMNAYDAVAYGPESSNSESIRLRMDRVVGKQNLDSYLSPVLKDFTRMGLTVLKSQKFKVGSEIGMLIDLQIPEKKIRLRQYVFLKQADVLLFQCRTPQHLLQETLKICNQIVQNLIWTQSPLAPAAKNIN